MPMLLFHVDCMQSAVLHCLCNVSVISHCRKQHFWSNFELTHQSLCVIASLTFDTASNETL